MKKLIKFNNIDTISVSLILLLTLARLIPHPPNFTPIIATAILGSYFFKNIYLSLFTIFISMLLTDLVLGFSLITIFVYLSIFILILIFFNFRKYVNIKNLFLYGFFGSLIFFIISNFGFWLINDIYEKNLSGLIECYILAIPFFKNTLLATILFSYSAYLMSIFLTKEKA